MHHSTPRLAALFAAMAALLISAQAHADHPTRGEMPKVKRAAHAVDNAATRLHRIAERRARHHTPEWALAALHGLENQASRFHAQVERYMAHPGQTEREWRRLYVAYRNALRAERALGHDRRVALLFDRLNRNMRWLNRAYRQSGFAYQRVIRLAHQLDNDAGHLHRQLERELRRRRGRSTRSERFAISLVHRLARSAEHLHDQVESRTTSAAHTRDDARQVKRLYESARRRLARLHLSKHLERDFYALQPAVDELARIYGIRSSHRSRWRAWR